MSKTTQNILKSQQESFKEQMLPVFNASLKATPFHYRSMAGSEHFEEPEHYDPELTRTMIRDMFSSACMGVKDEEKKKTILSWYTPLMDMNDTIMRMSGDLKAGRDLIHYPFDKSEELVRAIVDMNHEDIFKNSTVKGFNSLMQLMVKRIIMMDFWALAITVKKDIRDTDMQASIRATDNDGNIVYGISEKDEEIIHILNAMRGILAKVLVRLDPSSDESSTVTHKLEILDMLVYATMEDKMDELWECLKEKN